MQWHSENNRHPLCCIGFFPAARRVSLLFKTTIYPNEKARIYGEPFDREIMYWIGYLYRYWHYYTKESSRVIVKQAPPKTMAENYLTIHTMDPKMAIDELKEMYLKRAD